MRISAAYGIPGNQSDWDFFDSDTEYDLPLAIDPILLKRSGIKDENNLYLRFGSYFHQVGKYLLQIKLGNDAHIRQMVDFKEPPIGVGYTKIGHGGNGPGKSFGEKLLSFMRQHYASLVFNEKIEEDGFDPSILRLFVDDLGPDGISDFSASLIMDYLIGFTQAQCKAYGIPLKSLPSPRRFDFDDQTWFDCYESLPENPQKNGVPIIMIPKGLLRYIEDSYESNAKKGVLGFLRQDDNLKLKFGALVGKSLREISIEEIRAVLFEAPELYTKIVSDIQNGRESYDFDIDPREIGYKAKYQEYFAKLAKEKTEDGEEIFRSVIKSIDAVQESLKSGLWRNSWIDGNPCDERTFGRFFGFACESWFREQKDVTVIQEAGARSGYLDFFVIKGGTKVAIELKLLSNNSRKGPNRIPSYLHGLQVQLPIYIKNFKANYGIYLTLQHYDSDSARLKEIENLIPEVESELKNMPDGFEELIHINLDTMEKPSPSNA